MLAIMSASCNGGCSLSSNGIKPAHELPFMLSRQGSFSFESMVHIAEFIKVRTVVMHKRDNVLAWKTSHILNRLKNHALQCAMVRIGAKQAFRFRRIRPSSYSSTGIATPIPTISLYSAQRFPANRSAVPWPCCDRLEAGTSGILQTVPLAFCIACLEDSSRPA